MQELRLTRASLDFWVDVRLRAFDGRWLAVALLAVGPEPGTGDRPEEALAAALAVFGPPLGAELCATALTIWDEEATGD